MNSTRREKFEKLTVRRWVCTCPLYTVLQLFIENFTMSVTSVFSVLSLSAFHPIVTFCRVWMYVFYSCTIRFSAWLSRTEAFTNIMTGSWFTILQILVENLTSSMAPEPHLLILSTFIPVMAIIWICVFDDSTIMLMAGFSNTGEGYCKKRTIYQFQGIAMHNLVYKSDKKSLENQLTESWIVSQDLKS